MTLNINIAVCSIYRTVFVPLLRGTRYLLAHS